MSIKKYILFMLIGGLFQVSCSDFLDVKPVGRLIPTKVEELENLLNNVRSMDHHFMDNNRGSFYAYLGDNFTISENQANYQFTNTNPNVDRYAAYTFYQPYMNPNTAHVPWEWGIYRATGLLNNVISGIIDLGATADELGKAVDAQAKAARAWSYLVGTLGYGPMYDPAGDNQAKVLPFRTAANPASPNPDLSTTAALMDLIQQDLDDALNAPQSVANPSRANLQAVYGLRALFYMYKRDWTAMLENANQAWTRALAQRGNVDALIYDYNQFSYRPNPGASPTPGTDVEVGLDLQGPDLLLLQTGHRENLFYRPTPTGIQASVPSYPSASFLANFDPETDRRYQLFALKTLGYSVRVGTENFSDGIVVLYYRGAKMNISQGLTYPELLLMKAEANARLNNLSEALADLNLLRGYRYTGAETNLADGGTLGQDALISEIINERRRELPIGSFQRTFDLKRLALDSGKPWSQTTVTHHIGSQTYSAPLNSAYFTLPISNNILSFNPHWGIPLDTRAYTPKN